MYFEKNATSTPKALIGFIIFVVFTGLRVFFEIYFRTKDYGGGDDDDDKKYDHKDEWIKVNCFWKCRIFVF